MIGYWYVRGLCDNAIISNYEKIIILRYYITTSVILKECGYHGWFFFYYRVGWEQHHLWTIFVIECFIHWEHISH